MNSYPLVTTGNLWWKWFFGTWREGKRLWSVVEHLPRISQ